MPAVCTLRRRGACANCFHPQAAAGGPPQRLGECVGPGPLGREQAQHVVADDGQARDTTQPLERRPPRRPGQVLAQRLQHRSNLAYSWGVAAVLVRDPAGTSANEAR